MNFASFGPRAAAALVVVGCAFAPTAGATQLIVNGDFEADTAVIQSPDPFTAWTAAEDGIFGGVAINSGTSTPASGTTTIGAAGGNNYAVLDLAAPSKMTLAQSFSVGAAPLTSAVLSFEWFASYAGSERAFIDSPLGLDYSSDASVLTLRVDILKSGADAFSTSANDLLFSRYYTAPLNPGPTAYIAFAQGLSGLVAGETYSLRFAAAANRGLLTVGIDNVSLEVTAVPEPSSWALLAGGLVAIGFVTRRRG